MIRERERDRQRKGERDRTEQRDRHGEGERADQRETLTGRDSERRRDILLTKCVPYVSLPVRNPSL